MLVKGAPGDEDMCQWTGSSLVQVMAWRWFDIEASRLSSVGLLAGSHTLLSIETLTLLMLEMEYSSFGVNTKPADALVTLGSD